MGGDERLGSIIAIDARGIIQISTARVLMPFANAHKRLMLPWVPTKNRNFDDACLEFSVAGVGRTFQALELLHKIVSGDYIRVELDLEGGIGRTDFGEAATTGVAHRVGDRQTLEEGLQGHLRADLDEDMFIAPERIAHRLTFPSGGKRQGLIGYGRERMGIWPGFQPEP